MRLSDQFREAAADLVAEEDKVMPKQTGARAAFQALRTLCETSTVVWDALRDLAYKPKLDEATVIGHVKTLKDEMKNDARLQKLWDDNSDELTEVLSKAVPAGKSNPRAR